MRKLSVMILLWSLLLQACEKPLFDAVPSSLRASARQRARTSALVEKKDTTAAEPGKPDIFATALHFPETGGTEVLLIKNGKRILSVAGSSEPYRHRYKSGHLWTDMSDGSQTVLYRDGEEYCRFEGEELFLGFTLSGGQVHSLGQRQGQEGFCYRIDGREAFSSSSGTLLGTPFDEGWPDGAFSDDLHYVYGVPVWKGSELLWEYRLMHGAELVKILPATPTESIYDIRYYQEALYRSELRSGGSLCLAKDETVQQIMDSSSGDFHLCKLLPLGKEMLVRGYSYKGGVYTHWLRDMSGVRFIASSSNRYYGIFADENRQAQVILDNNGAVLSIWKDREPIAVTPGAYTFHTPACCDFRHGVFAAALSAKNGQQHILLADEKRDTVRFNGFFTSLQIQ